MQNRGQLFWGIALITAGLLFFGQRMGWFDFDLGAVRNLWPILMILAGVNLILVRRNQQAALATTILLGLAVPLILFSFVGQRRNWHDWRNNHRFDYRNNNSNNNNDTDNADSDDNEDEDTDSSYDEERADRTKTESVTAFVEAMTPATRTATLNLVGGAGRFSIGEPVAELIKADAKQTMGSYKMDVDRDADTQNATINLKPSDGEKDSDGDVNINLGDGDIDNRLDVRLNDKPVWTVNATVGAGKGTFDLSRYVVRNLKLEAGAADVELTLGGKATQSDVKISAGVASITVRVPKNVGVKVKREGAMNVNTLDGFTDTGGNTSISPDYEKAANKINIDFEGGISTFKVVRY